MDLNLVSHQAKRYRQEQTGQLERFCDKGYRWLARALEREYAQPEVLNRALDEFMSAIQLQPKWVNAYIGVAYILLLLGERDEAQVYLREALSLEPQHADALALYQAAQKSAALIPVAQQSGGDRVEDFDQLYEQLGAEIKVQTLKWFEKPALELSLETEDIQAYGQTQAELQQCLNQFQNQMHLLGQEMEIEALQFQLNPLEQLLRRYARVYQRSTEFKQLADEIQSQQSQVQQLILTFKRHSEQTQEEAQADLDTLYDHCDRIADQLDQYDHQGLCIAALLPRYEKLIRWVEEFTQCIDERG